MINNIKVLPYKKSNYSARKKSNFNDYSTNFSILSTRLKQKTSKRPKTFTMMVENLVEKNLHSWTNIYNHFWINQPKISGTHEHQGEIEDDRFNIEPYSTTKIRLLIPQKNNAWCEKEALL
jgi:hypothetical protein